MNNAAVRRAKQYGQFFTPRTVARALVRWALADANGRILDPACGDGQFLACHDRAVGVELDTEHAATAARRAPRAFVHAGVDFFEWAARSNERFEAAVGNPPFIRYQGFAGSTRQRALAMAQRIGADLPALTSSWAPFVAAAAALVKPAGRIAFVVPAEIGHAAYAKPLLIALCRSFSYVQIVALRRQLFPELAEDAWLLYCRGRGGDTSQIHLSILDSFEESPLPPAVAQRIPIEAITSKHGHLRRWLLPDDIRIAYETVQTGPGVVRLGDVAYVGIGYVTGANDFFHLRPSDVRRLAIPKRFLRPAVRKGESLPRDKALTVSHVRTWIAADKPLFLLYLTAQARKEHAIRRYLATPAADKARTAYKCRVRKPWYVVPAVSVPDGFLTYMSGERVSLIQNKAGCVATNSVHVVSMNAGCPFDLIQRGWDTPLARLSCEIEGHPLGGGMLKIEPREAQRIVVPREGALADPAMAAIFERGVAAMRRWRHLS